MFSTSQYTPTDKLLSEIANKTKETNKLLCCINSAEEYIPVFEYKDLLAPILTSSSLDTFYYNISGTSLAIGFKTPFVMVNSCDTDEDPTEVSTIVNMKWEDSFGRSSSTASSISFNFAEFLTKTFTVKITVTLANNFIFSYLVKGYTDGSGNPTVSEILPYSSNTNNNNHENLAVGYIFQEAVADLLEVRANGAFVKYVDLNHVDYVPTQCLSYDPVQPLKTFSDEPFTGIYNTPQVISVNNSTKTIAANSVHSIRYYVTGGAPTITISGVTITLAVGDNSIIEGTGLLNLAVVFTCGAGDTAVLTITKP